MADKVFLIGFMGSGKSTSGRRLALHLNCDFVDTDNEIERIAGLSIADIFANKGEEWFREVEKNIIESLPEIEQASVIALGGGAACRDGVMEMLNEAGTSFYLKMSPEQLVSRIDERGRKVRPKIKGMDDRQLLAYINKILPEREKHYNKANFVVDCNGMADEQVVGLLLQKIAQQ